MFREIQLKLYIQFYVYISILYSVCEIEFFLHADQILSKLPDSRERLSRLI